MGLHLNYLWTHCETVLGPGTTYQQRLEWACIFEDTCKAFIYLPSSTAGNIQQINIAGGEKKKLILIAILMLRADIGHRKANAGTL